MWLLIIERNGVFGYGVMTSMHVINDYCRRINAMSVMAIGG
jgi:hypothetical protein